MFDTVIVGAGSAGCVVAARLAQRGHSVLLLEAGQLDVPSELRDISSFVTTGAWNWAHPVELRLGLPHAVPRGRGLGGSSTVNGAVWMRVTPADADGWGVPGWTWSELLPHYVRSETDHDVEAPWHGTSGPVHVRRPAGALLHGAAERFLVGAERLGYPAEPDKNAGAAPGAGLVPSNAVGGVRVNAGMAYLGDRPAVTIRGDATVRTVLLDGDHARGVELMSGEVVVAGEVVIAAGAVGTPHLLLRSGIGPADDLRTAGVPVRHDLPGVGRDWSDHPAVFLPFADVEAAHAHAPGWQAALALDSGADPAGDVELLLHVRPFVPGGPLHLMCALHQPDSRGMITLDPRDPTAPPRIEYHYLRSERDRRRLRHAIRTGAELLRAGLGARVEPAGDVLGNDRALDGWVAANLTTAVHMCGSAAMGSVVDADLRVCGLQGLRIADTSVLPVVPRRGTAATAVAIGEKAATLLS